MTPNLQRRASSLLEICNAGGLTIATAESCTGGLVVSLLTSIAGSSSVVECGFVTYSNEAKQRVLGVPASVLANNGAVSRECAIAMAEGALANSEAVLAVSITGIAGPGGGTATKPVGLVHFACATKNAAIHHRMENFGDIGRHGVRIASVEVALEMLEKAAAG